MGGIITAMDRKHKNKGRHVQLFISRSTKSLKILIFFPAFVSVSVTWADQSETWCNTFLHINYVSDFGLRLKFDTLVSAKDKVI